MNVPDKKQWKATASGGDPRLAIDNRYATAWMSEPSEKSWLQIDIGAVAPLGGLEIYWGKQAAEVYEITTSLEGERWSHLCGTRYGEGGQNVFAFPPTVARFVRWSCNNSSPERRNEIVEINLYAPDNSASVLEEGRIAALGHAPIKLPVGASVTVDFGYERLPLGALIDWGEAYGVVFSVHLSDDGASFREIGRISTGNGGNDSFWWRYTISRYIRFSLHEASSPDGAIVNEIKLRVLNKDRMPIGQLERAALAARADLHPQSLLGRQVYWTALGEFDRAEEALFDEFGNLEPQIGSGQMMPLLRLGGVLHGAPASADIKQHLAEGSLPIPSVTWSAQDIELQTTALAHRSEALVEYRVMNRSGVRWLGALVLALRPVQINPYWQHGGHAVINAIAIAGRQMWVNDRIYAAFSREPEFIAIADFDGGDVVRLIEKGPQQTDRSLRSDTGLLSAACEFVISLSPGDSIAFVVSSPMRSEIAPHENRDFSGVREKVAGTWREKIGPRRIVVGDQEISDTVEAQIALILVNADRHSFKPGPRNYDRIWIRDGSSQAVALLWAGLIGEAKAYVLWYSERVREDGLVHPILNPDGTVNLGYGSDIEFDAQGQFVGVAAEVYRISRDRDFLRVIFEPVVRATRFIEELCGRTNALYDHESRFHGLLAPSISHEGYSKPSYSYWDNFFALSAWRDCEYLATEIGDLGIAAHAREKSREFAADLARSMRMTTECLGTKRVHGSADREDVDATSTSIAFEPCRTEDILPSEFIGATYDDYIIRHKAMSAPGFDGNCTPYEIRNVNALVSLGRLKEAFELLSAALAWRRPIGWRHWAEVVWSDLRAPEYIGDMPHTWIGAEFAATVRRMLVRENGATLELFRAVPDAWWDGRGIALHELPTAFGLLRLTARRNRSQAVVELSLSGPTPKLITVRYPGVRQARADGRPCNVEGDLISAPRLGRLVIDF